MGCRFSTTSCQYLLSNFYYAAIHLFFFLLWAVEWYKALSGQATYVYFHHCSDFFCFALFSRLWTYNRFHFLYQYWNQITSQYLVMFMVPESHHSSTDMSGTLHKYANFNAVCIPINLTAIEANRTLCQPAKPGLLRSQWQWSNHWMALVFTVGCQ